MPDRKNNERTRPRKSGAAKKRRSLEHRRRLTNLGVPEEKVRTMDTKAIRTLLAKPKLIKQVI